MKILLAACTTLSLSLALASAPAHAGVYTDDLTKCLVSSTSDADKEALVKWIFSAIALKKELAQYVQIPADEREKINKDAAGIYMRLLTDTCRTQTRDAFKYEGQPAIASAFQVLGQVASAGLFNSPEVGAGMEGLTRHFDQAKLSAVLESK